MRVSQLRLPDPLQEREDEMADSKSEESWQAASAAGVDTASEYGLSDIDRMSLPSSTGLSQLSVVDDDGVDGFSQGGLEMSVALTRPSRASGNPHSQMPIDDRNHAPLDANSDIGDGYSIISLTHGCPSPSYCITGVRTPPPAAPLRSSPLHKEELSVHETQSSLPRNLKEYVNGLSAANKQNNDDDEHQKNFEIWLKSVTPYSQRTCGSDNISSMSSLASPLPVPSPHSSGLLAGSRHDTKITAQSLYERYARLRQTSVLLKSEQKPVDRDNSSHGLPSMLTLHSSDVSVRVPAVTDSPGSVKARQPRPMKSSHLSTPLSDSYTAALETIEQLCDTADESDSFIDQPLSSSADQSFKTALTSLERASSARLGISREYDGGDELASFGSSSGDSAWKTEDNSDLEGTSSDTTTTSGEDPGQCGNKSTLRAFVRSLMPTSYPQAPSKPANKSTWLRYYLGSIVMLSISIYIGTYLLSAVAQSSHTVKEGVETEEPYEYVKQHVVKAPTIALARAAVSSISIPTCSTPTYAQDIAQQIQHFANIHSRPSTASHVSMGSMLSLRNDLLEFLFILALFFSTAYFMKLTISKVKTIFKPKPVSSSLRYVAGRKIVIRPTRKLSEAADKNSRADKEKGSSVECPIDLSQEDQSVDLASSSSSIVTVVPAQTQLDSAATSAVDRVTKSRENRADSTPAKVRGKEISTPRDVRSATLSPPGSDRVLRSQARLQRASEEPEDRASTPVLPLPSAQGKEKQIVAVDSSPVRSSVNKFAKPACRAQTAPPPQRAVEDGGSATSRAPKAKAASVPARDRRHESFHICFIHGSPGVGKASLLQRAKRGTYFDPEHPIYPGPESINEFKTLSDIKHMHFEKRDKLTTLVFGYGRMLEQPDSRESKAWKELNEVYTLPDAERSKFDKRGNNAHIFLYTIDDKASQQGAARSAAGILGTEPESQIAMVLAKCDLMKSERTLDLTQAQMHALLKQLLGAAHCLDHVSYHRTSAKTTRGVDDLFRDIARKLRKESIPTVKESQTLPMELD